MNRFRKLISNKFFVVGFAVVIVLMEGLFLKQIIEQLRVDERQQMETWASAIRAMSHVPDYNAEFDFLLKIINENHSIPCILMGIEGNILKVQNVDTAIYNTDIKLLQLATTMADRHPPIAIFLPQGVRARMYYGESKVRSLLQMSTAITLTTLVLFFFLLNTVMSTWQRADKHRLWVGLAKETAHQLGTPITSMLGWVELLKEGECSPEVVVEMEKDVQRLQKVSCKFSQIGSAENVQCVDVIKIARDSMSYMRHRISKRAQLVDATNGLSVFANVNVMLWEWVVENLLKNALDAIGQKPGTIELLAHKDGNKIFVDVRDTGRGIANKRLYTTIFQHGYTTKAKGWGVGLSLCYRIVRELFRGRIFVLQSSPAGTTIRVVLTVA